MFKKKQRWFQQKIKKSLTLLLIFLMFINLIFLASPQNIFSKSTTPISATVDIPVSHGWHWQLIWLDCSQTGLYDSARLYYSDGTPVYGGSIAITPSAPKYRFKAVYIAISISSTHFLIRYYQCDPSTGLFTSSIGISGNEYDTSKTIAYLRIYRSYPYNFISYVNYGTYSFSCSEPFTWMDSLETLSNWSEIFTYDFSLYVKNNVYSGVPLPLPPPPVPLFPAYARPIPNVPWISTTTPTFEWSSVSETDKYELLLGNQIYNNSNITSTSFTIPQGYLSDKQIYSYIVRAHNLAGWGEWGAIWSFTVVNPPVLLVHGFQPTIIFDPKDIWKEMAKILSDNDQYNIQKAALAIPDESHFWWKLPGLNGNPNVYISNYSHGSLTIVYNSSTHEDEFKIMGRTCDDIRNYAFNLSKEIEYIKQKENVDKVDIVAHSMGGLVTRAYIESKDFGNDYYSKDVKNLIMLGTPNHGAILAWLAFYPICISGSQMRSNSSFLSTLNSGITNENRAQYMTVAGEKGVYEYKNDVLVNTYTIPDDEVVTSNSVPLKSNEANSLNFKVHYTEHRNIKKYTDIIEAVQNKLVNNSLPIGNVINIRSEEQRQLKYSFEDVYGQKFTQILFFCPLNITVSDQNGNIINSSGLNQIENAEFHIINDTKAFYLPLGLTYDIKAEAYDSSSFTLLILSPDIKETQEIVLIFKDIPITSLTKTYLTITQGLPLTFMEIDKNGDGIIDEKRVPDIYGIVDENNIIKQDSIFKYSLFSDKNITVNGESTITNNSFDLKDIEKGAIRANNGAIVINGSCDLIGSSLISGIDIRINDKKVTFKDPTNNITFTLDKIPSGYEFVKTINKKPVKVKELNLDYYQYLYQAFLNGTYPYDGGKEDYPDTRNTDIHNAIVNTLGLSFYTENQKTYYYTTEERVKDFYDKVMNNKLNLSSYQIEMLKKTFNSIVFFLYNEKDKNIEFKNTTNLAGTIITPLNVIIKGDILQFSQNHSLALLSKSGIVAIGQSSLNGLFFTEGSININGNTTINGSIVSLKDITINGGINLTYKDYFNLNPNINILFIEE